MIKIKNIFYFLCIYYIVTMSNVKTMTQLLSDSDVIEVSKKEMDSKINSLKSRIVQLTTENKEKGAESKSSKKNVESYIKALNLLKADRDTLKQKFDELQKQIEQMKKHNNKPVQKITGFENLFENDVDKEKGIEEIYKKNYQKKDDELDKYLMDFIK